jgi:hypothetical protein
MQFSQPTSGFRVPGPYDSELAAIARREKMAQIMQQQALQPLEINSFQGFQAPISPLQGIAKVLQMYAGMTASDRGDDARAELGRKIRTEGSEQLASLDGMPAQPAIAPTPGTSFTPMGADFEDNPNLQVAPSGNVETPGTPGRAAIPAMPLNDEQKKQRLVQILSGGNPYAAPVAKLMWEDIQKANTGPLAQYKLAVQQGYKGTIKDYEIEQSHAKRSIQNVSNLTMGAPVVGIVDGKKVFFQPGNRPGAAPTIIQGISPVEKETDLAQELADAGITRDNPKFQELAQAYINKKLLITSSPGQYNTQAGDTPPAYVPTPIPGATLERNENNELVPKAIPGAAGLNAEYQGAQASAESGQRVLGTSQAQATIDLPKVVDNATTAIKHVNELVSHPGFKSSVGMGVPGMKYISGTKEADFRSRFSQVEGGSFLRAIDTLKGSGAITEVEGTKATSAVNRMSTATSEEEFNKAAKDYVDIVQQGVKQTYGRAKQEYVPVPNFEAKGQPKTINYGDLKR